MIIKPKIIGSTTPTTGDYAIRFQYLTVENSNLVSKIDTFYANAGESITAPSISSTINAITNQCPALSLEDSSFPWNILTRVYIPTANTGVLGVSINEATWKAYSVIVSNGVGEYRFAYTTQWDLTKKNGANWDSISTNVTLANYGLTIGTGSATSGDYIHVNYKDFTNIQTDLDVSAIYKPTDDKTTAFLTVNSGTGLTVPVYFKKSDTSTLTISWGDGTSDYTTTSSGVVNTTHTYSTAGTYELKIWISSGTGTFLLGNDTTNNFIGGTTQSYRDCLTKLYIGNKVTSLGVSSIQLSYNLNLITISNSVTTIGNSSIYNCRGLENIYLPSSITQLGVTSAAISQCSDLFLLSLSTSITNIAGSAFTACAGLTTVIIPNGVTSLSDSCFANTYILKLKIPPNITTVGNSTFSTLLLLNSFDFPITMTTIGTSLFRYCYALKSITVPATITSLPATTFDNCLCLKSITIKKFTVPSEITTLDNVSALTNINNSFRIYVPVGSLSVYQNATNWSTYSARMYEDTAQNRALFGD